MAPKKKITELPTTTVHVCMAHRSKEYESTPEEYVQRLVMKVILCDNLTINNVIVKKLDPSYSTRALALSSLHGLHAL